MAVTADLAITAGDTDRPSPSAIFFDATGSRSTAESTQILAFPHLLYFMDYGDETSGNWGDGTFGHAGAQTGLARNEEYSPVGSHVYEVADGAGDATFTATVYVTDGATTDSATQNITVRDPNGASGYSSTLCVETAATGTGGPAGATYLTSSDFDAAFNTTANHGTTHPRILFKKGQAFTASAACLLNVDNVMIGAWSSGAAPTVDFTAGGTASLFQIGESGPDTITGVVISDLDCNGNDGTGNFGMHCHSSPQNVLFLRCDMHNFHRPLNISSSVILSQNATAPIPKGIFIHDTTSRVTNSSSGNCAFIMGKGLAVMGCLMHDSTAGEHILRIPHAFPSIVGHNYLHTPASTKHAVKYHCPEADDFVIADGGVARFAVYIQNRFKGATGCAWVVTIGPEDDTSPELVTDVIVDANWFEPQAATQRHLKVWASRTTVRNNLFDLSSTFSHVGIDIETRGVEGAHDDCECYNNTFYHPDAARMWCFVVSTGSGHLIRNNLAYAPNNTDPIMVQGSGYTASNNTADTDMDVDPLFASATPVNPADFKITNGSYAEAAGFATVNLGTFFVPTTRIGIARDLGFHQFNAGDVFPAEGGGSAIAEQEITSVGLWEAQTNPSIISVW